MTPTPRRREALAVLVAGLGLLLLAAYRAHLGVSFYDDTHYVTVALRIASGARPLADEMSLQSLGFLAPAAFVWAWIHLFGTTGLVLAFRLFYLVLATGTAVIVYHALRGSFRPAIAGLAAIVPLVCVPFNLLAPSYNTLAMLGFLIAFALSWAAWRDGGRVSAFFAGVAMAFMSVSYPPLSAAAVALFATLALLSRSRHVVLAAVLGATAVIGLLLAGLAPFVHGADVSRTLAYASSNVIGFGSPLYKLERAAAALAIALAAAGLLPMWVLAVYLRRPPASPTLTAGLLLMLPVAATVPGLWWLRGSTRLPVFGNTAASWLITFTIAALIPLLAWLKRTEHADDVRRLLLLAAPCAAVGFVVVSYSTDASLVRAVSVTGMVPLGAAVLVGWASMVEETGDGWALLGAWAVVMLSACTLLYTTTVDDRRPLMLHAGVNSGPYLGMRMSPGRRDELLAVQKAGAKYVKPGDRVTFLGERTGYLLVGGQPFTNAVWLYAGPSDKAALDYFARQGAMPDVVFVDDMALRKLAKPDYRAAAPTDPLITQLLARYRLAETVANFGVFVRR